MPILAWLQNNFRGSVVFKQLGFTMIELLVVLVILGLTSALVLPKFPAIYERFKGKAEEDKFYQSLSVLNLKAYTQQTTLVLDENSVRSLLDLPESWQITIDNPIIYKSSGLCLGGKVGLSVNGVAREIVLKPPYCDPSRSALMNITQESARD